MSRADQIEQNLVTNVKSVDSRSLSRTLATQVEFIGGRIVTVNLLLESDFMAQVAIDEALIKYDQFNEVVGHIPEDQRKKLQEERREELLGHLEVMQRANKNTYNGRSAMIRDYTQNFIGNFLVSSQDRAKGMSIYQQELAKQAKGMIIFDANSNEQTHAQ